MNAPQTFWVFMKILKNSQKQKSLHFLKMQALWALNALTR
jgi:hypothetical protein